MQSMGSKKSDAQILARNRFHRPQFDTIVFKYFRKHFHNYTHSDRLTGYSRKESITCNCSSRALLTRRPLSIFFFFVLVLAIQLIIQQFVPQVLYAAGERQAPGTVSSPPLPGYRHPIGNLHSSLEVFWTETNIGSKICRIKKICMLRNGSFLLHPFLRNMSSTLNECNLKNILYMEASSDYDTNQSTSLFDLFGGTPARTHIPHFVTDTLLVTYATELIWPTTHNRLIKRNITCNNMPTCSYSHYDKSVLRGIYVDDKVSKLKNTDWVPQYTRFFLGNPRIISLQQSFSNSRSDKVCYNSLISYKPSRFILKETAWYSKRNSIYRSKFLNGLNHSTQFENEFKKLTCKLRILIISRFEQSRRSIIDVDMLKAKLVQSTTTSTELSVNLDIKVVFFENMGFNSQVKCFYGVDIVIGAHGAGLSNIVFAENHSLLIEIFPFSYYAGPFNRISKSLFLKYSSVIAKPDSASFFKCIAHQKSKLGINNFKNLIEESTLLWDQALSNFNNRSHLLDFSQLRGNFSSFLRYCARYQQLMLGQDSIIRLVHNEIKPQISELCIDTAD